MLTILCFLKHTHQLASAPKIISLLKGSADKIISSVPGKGMGTGSHSPDPQLCMHFYGLTDFLHLEPVSILLPEAQDKVVAPLPILPTEVIQIRN